MHRPFETCCCSQLCVRSRSEVNYESRQGADSTARDDQQVEESSESTTVATEGEKPDGSKEVKRAVETPGKLRTSRSNRLAKWLKGLVILAFATVLYGFVMWFYWGPIIEEALDGTS